jgi:hypothetical protein
MVSVLLQRAARLSIGYLLMVSRVSTAGSLLKRLMPDAVLVATYAQVCCARRDWPPCADIWNFRRDWTKEKRRLKAELASWQFRFGVLDRIWKCNGSEIELWEARDALVLKTMSIVLWLLLRGSPRCTRVKSHGGVKATVQLLNAQLPANRFVLRTGVKSYYACIYHVLLMDRLARSVRDRTILNHCGQYLKRTAEQGGWFWSHERWISSGCP